MLDLDGLKQVNDTAGHAAGDRYIRVAGATLQSAVRVGDLVARLGGDEFGVLASSCPPQETANLVDRLRTALQIAGVASSVGYAPYTFAAGFPGAWEAADVAMYADKRLRRQVGLISIPESTYRR